MRWFNRIIPIFQMRKLRDNERLVQGQTEACSRPGNFITLLRLPVTSPCDCSSKPAHSRKAHVPNKQPFHNPKWDFMWLSGQKPEDDGWPACYHQLNTTHKEHPLFVLNAELAQSIKPPLIPLKRQLLVWSQTHASHCPSRVTDTRN